MRLELPFPPSTNHYWGSQVRGKRVHRFIDKAGRAFRDEVMAECLVQRAGLLLRGPLRSTVVLFPPDNRRRDLDNFAGKALYDALTHAKVYGDDAQVRSQRHDWGPVTPGGRCVITLEPMEGEQCEFSQVDFLEVV